MDKRKKRVFIITIMIKDEVWNYKKGQIIKSAIISNSSYRAINSFEDRHCGGDYPYYEIIDIEDTFCNGFFMPNIESKNLL